MDPLAAKNNHLSPYHAFNNNPILYVDPDGQDNVIYLINIPTGSLTGNKNLIHTKYNVKKIAKQTEKLYRKLHIKTDVVVLDIDYKDFNRDFLDPTDAVAFVGNPMDLNEVLKDYGSSWRYVGNDIDDPLDYSPGIITVDATQGANYQRKLKTNSVEQALAFGIAHGSTHLTLSDNQWHENNPDFKKNPKNLNYANSGDVVGGNIQNWGAHLTDFFQIGKAKFTIAAHKEKFKDNEPRANYYLKSGEMKTYDLNEVTVKPKPEKE